MISEQEEWEELHWKKFRIKKPNIQNKKYFKIWQNGKIYN